MIVIWEPATRMRRNFEKAPLQAQSPPNCRPGRRCLSYRFQRVRAKRRDPHVNARKLSSVKTDDISMLTFITLRESMNSYLLL